MEKMELFDSVDNICIDMEKAKLLVDEIRSEYLTGLPIMTYNEERRKDFMCDLFLDFNRYSTFLDILWDYLINVDKGLGALREVIQKGLENENKTILLVTEETIDNVSIQELTAAHGFFKIIFPSGKECLINKNRVALISDYEPLALPDIPVYTY